jgi:hypothetical protein
MAYSLCTLILFGVYESLRLDPCLTDGTRQIVRGSEGISVILFNSENFHYLDRLHYRSPGLISP